MSAGLLGGAMEEKIENSTGLRHLLSALGIVDVHINRITNVLGPMLHVGYSDWMKLPQTSTFTTYIKVVRSRCDDQNNS